MLLRAPCPHDPNLTPPPGGQMQPPWNCHPAAPPWRLSSAPTLPSHLMSRTWSHLRNGFHPLSRTLISAAPPYFTWEESCHQDLLDPAIRISWTLLPGCCPCPCALPLPGCTWALIQTLLTSATWRTRTSTRPRILPGLTWTNQLILQQDPNYGPNSDHGVCWMPSVTLTWSTLQSQLHHQNLCQVLNSQKWTKCWYLKWSTSTATGPHQPQIQRGRQKDDCRKYSPTRKISVKPKLRVNKQDPEDWKIPNLRGPKIFQNKGGIRMRTKRKGLSSPEWARNLER